MAYPLPSLRPQNSLLLLLLFSSCCFLTLLNPTSSYVKNPTDLVKSICKNTTITNYAFCVDSLYSDKLTPTADAPTIAVISFDLAWTSATLTKAYIQASLLGHGGGYLRRCDVLYGNAVRALELALNDLNAEDYYSLASYAAESARAAGGCQAALRRGKAFRSALTPMNRRSSDLAKICIVVSHLFKLGSRPS